ncbi:MAG: D-alanine-D-alanine ligase [Gammaproteobacteria bacterium]|jgi:D-alanine-D-alanine ligase
MTTDFGKVAVLMGGTSAEREISIETGSSVFDALCRIGVDAHVFDTRDRTLLDLVREKFDRAFIALHGRGGEDGTIQGALQSMGIPYTGSGVLGSALAIDKVRSKLIWKSIGLPTPDFIEVRPESDLTRVPIELGFPLIVKPVNEGSSLGVAKVNNKDELLSACKKSFALDNRVLIEKWIVGKEYTAAVLRGKVLPMIALETPRVFYDFEAKYKESSTQYICPVNMENDKKEKLEKLVKDAFDAIDASGWGRVDFIVDEEDVAWLIELNTVPGMTSHSLVPMSANQAGISFDELVSFILETSINIYRNEKVTIR